jgi:hypothetical protein
VRHVSEEGAAGLELLDPSKRLVDVGGGGMWLRPQRVDNEHVEVLDQRKARVGDGAHVSQVSRRSEAEAADSKTAVKQGHALKADSGNIGEFVVIETVELYAGTGRILGVRLEGVLKDALEDVGCCVIGIEAEAARVAKAERTEVVHAEDVVGMRVRIEDRVDMADSFPQCLIAKVGSRVDDHRLAGPVVRPLDSDRRTAAGIPRIGGSTDVTFASERGDAHRSAAAKDEDLSLQGLFGPPWRVRSRLLRLFGDGVGDIEKHHPQLEQRVL